MFNELDATMTYASEMMFSHSSVYFRETIAPRNCGRLTFAAGPSRIGAEALTGVASAAVDMSN